MHNLALKQSAVRGNQNSLDSKPVGRRRSLLHWDCCRLRSVRRTQKLRITKTRPLPVTMDVNRCSSSTLCVARRTTKFNGGDGAQRNPRLVQCLVRRSSKALLQ